MGKDHYTERLESKIETKAERVSLVDYYWHYNLLLEQNLLILASQM